MKKIVAMIPLALALAMVAAVSQARADEPTKQDAAAAKAAAAARQAKAAFGRVELAAGILDADELRGEVIGMFSAAAGAGALPAEAIAAVAALLDGSAEQSEYALLYYAGSDFYYDDGETWLIGGNACWVDSYWSGCMNAYGAAAEAFDDCVSECEGGQSALGFANVASFDALSIILIYTGQGGGE